MKHSGLIIGALLVFIASNAMASSVFQDDFESGLGQWTTGSGEIVVGPIAPNITKVLRFASVTAGGDIFTSTPFSITGGQWYELSFDYLGTNTSNSGGFIGLSEAAISSHTWIAGTLPGSLNPSGTIGIELDPPSTSQRELIDDNTWHNYAIKFKANSDMLLRVMVEDFQSNSVPRDAYFDNINVASVPLPAAAWGGMMLLGCLGGGRLLGRKQN